MSLTRERPPEKLLEMIKNLKYKDGWSFSYHIANEYRIYREALGFLRIAIITTDSTGQYKQIDPDNWEKDFFNSCNDPLYDFGGSRSVHPFQVIHTIPIPEAFIFGNNVPFMRRWLIDQVIAVETHEAMEFFKLPISDGETGIGYIRDGYYAPFFPHSEEHGPYRVVDHTVSKET